MKVVGIKSEYVTTIKAVEEVLGDFPKVRICALKAAYPMGDEVVLIYEATGRVIKPGGLPIDENVVVYNVETMYNLYEAVYNNTLVSNKLVSIVGEIDNPVTIRVPLGTSVKDTIAMAGKPTVSNPAYVMGGSMMGRLGTDNTVITKTTNAIIILLSDHKLVAKMNKNLSIEKKRASSSCCQCRTCTDLCSRHALGHSIEPHKIMRAVANNDTSDLSAVRASVDSVKGRYGDKVIDNFVLGNPHDSIFPAIYGTNQVEKVEALGILETYDVAALIVAADLAAKTAIDKAKAESADRGMFLDSAVIARPSDKLVKYIM